MKLILAIFLVFCLGHSTMAQKQPVGSLSFQKHLKKAPEKHSDFAVKGNRASLERRPDIHYKYQNGVWHFIRCSSTTLANLMHDNVVEQVYFTPSAPRALNDSMRLVHNIDSAYNGHYPLQERYTGKGVIIGYIDTGLDFTHEDFLNVDGSTRVLRYWDHSLENDPVRTPIKYGYGQVWTNEDIDAGNCTSTDNRAHGTTVTGTGSGNGRALNEYRGVAPNSDIIIVESDFSLPNWTLTIADAIDYIFAVADSLGKPAVVNTSLGDYLGSHDGSDPASQIIDSLLNAKTGRIVVAAAGNSGNWDRYHVRGNVTSDTSFTWLEVNPSSPIFEDNGAGVFFDLWADTSDFKDVQFSFGAIDSMLDFEQVGQTQFYNIQSLLNLTTSDSIMVGGQKVSPVEFYCEEVNGVYHIEVLMENPDSTNYLYAFNTTTAQTAQYDLWSGFAIGLSRIKNTNLPSVLDYPSIVHYQYPDSLFSTVSSWTCSEHVITVANVANQLDYIDQNGNTITLNHIPGNLSINSSKGPNRIGEQKPDISATGDGTLSACPQYLINILTGNGGTSLAQGEKHVLNGGTSMACPVIAGIAALYLEKCNLATHLDFKEELLATAKGDNFTGPTPNSAFGHGKIDAFELLSRSSFIPAIIGDTLICDDTAFVEAIEADYLLYEWSNGIEVRDFSTTEGDTVSLIATDQKGCRGYSDELVIVKGEVPISPIINVIGGGLVTTPAYQHQWFIDNAKIVDGVEQYFNPSASGDYYVVVTGPEGCKLSSDTVPINVETIRELEENEFVIFPNPFTDEFQIIKNDAFEVAISIYDFSGRNVYDNNSFAEDDLFLSISVPKLPAGAYILQLQFSDSYKIIKLFKE